MILTDKCKTDFGIWHFERSTPLEEYKNFHLLSDTCKNALVVEFFDTVGLTITVSFCVDKTFDSFVANDKYEEIEASQFQKTRQEATNKAIEKANEIYNKL
jgi:hypothetical protein